MKKLFGNPSNQAGLKDICKNDHNLLTPQYVEVACIVLKLHDGTTEAMPMESRLLSFVVADKTQ